jgi:hypothetical protein
MNIAPADKATIKAFLREKAAQKGLSKLNIED